MEEAASDEHREDRHCRKFGDKTNTNMDTDPSNRWRTVTSDSYLAPRSEVPKSLGRRRELFRNFIELGVFGETINAMIAEIPVEASSPSEYVENFCDSEFVPFMDRAEYGDKEQSKYPLYGGAGVQSYYKSQLDKGSLKARSEISDFNQPFRRSCSFTTPPDLALREPTGGF